MKTFKYHNPICKYGHDKRVVGTSKVGNCKACARNRGGVPLAEVPRLHCRNGHELAKHGTTHRKGCSECVRVSWQKTNWKGFRNSDGGVFTALDFDRLYQIQSGSCAVCKKHQSELSRALNVDHDHATGFVRGLLCDSCNKALGLIFDNQDIANNLSIYLKSRENSN